MKQAFAALLFALAVPAVQAETLDINLSDQTLRGVFAGPLSSLFPRVEGVYELGALFGEEEDRDFVQAHGGLLVTGDAGAQRANVTAGLGGRLVALDADGETGGALALGGMFEGRLPAFNRIGTVLYVYGAPRASSFGNIDGYLEYSAGIDYQVLRNASLYAGYRQLKVEIKDGEDVTVDNGWHLGLRLHF